MRRIIRVAVVAVITLLFAEAGVRALEPALPQLTTWREPLVAAKVAQMDRLGHTDVVFAGSSQMLFAGDPTMLRKQLKVPWTAYNAGLWGAPPVVNEHWLTTVVVPRLRPKTIVYGISAGDLIEADTDAPMRTYFSSTAVRKDWLGGVDRSFVSHSALFRQRKSLRNPQILMKGIGRRIDGEPGPGLAQTGIDAVGRLPQRDGLSFRGDAPAKAVIAGVIKRGWVVSRPQLDAFRRSVGTIRDRGIEVIVADMAITQPMIELLGKDGYASYRSFIREQADSLGVTLLDLAGGVTDTKFFFDYDHVNRAGANVFNTTLARAFRPARAGRFVQALDPQVATKPLSSVLASDVITQVKAKPAPKVPAPKVPAPSPVPAPTPRPIPVPSLVPTAPPASVPVDPPLFDIGP